MKNQKGFTLIEIIIVIAMIGVVAGCVVGIIMCINVGRELTSQRSYIVRLNNAEIEQTKNEAHYKVSTEYGTWNFDGALWGQKKSPYDMYRMVKENDGKCFAAKVIGLRQPVVLDLKRATEDECKEGVK